MDTQKYLKAKLSAIYKDADKPVIEGMGRRLIMDLEIEIERVKEAYEDYMKHTPHHVVYDW